MFFSRVFGERWLAGSGVRCAGGIPVTRWSFVTSGGVAVSVHVNVHVHDSTALREQCQPHFSGNTFPEGQVLPFLGGFIAPGSH